MGAEARRPAGLAEAALQRPFLQARLFSQSLGVEGVRLTVDLAVQVAPLRLDLAGVGADMEEMAEPRLPLELDSILGLVVEVTLHPESAEAQDRVVDL